MTIERISIFTDKDVQRLDDISARLYEVGAFSLLAEHYPAYSSVEWSVRFVITLQKLDMRIDAAQRESRAHTAYVMATSGLSENEFNEIMSDVRNENDSAVDEMDKFSEKIDAVMRDLPPLLASTSEVQ